MTRYNITNRFPGKLLKLDIDNAGDLWVTVMEEKRLPTIKELKTLIGAEGYFETFGENAASYYWSSTEYADYPYYAWVVNFYDGSVSHFFKDDGDYVRCVRNGQSVKLDNLIISTTVLATGGFSGPRFADNDDGTITDNLTGLIWDKEVSGPMTWNAAMEKWGR